MFFEIVLVSVLVILAIVAFSGKKYKGVIVYAIILVVAAISSYYAISALNSFPLEWQFSGSLVMGVITLKLDALSAWFILIINFIFLTACFYGYYYLRSYKTTPLNLTMHGVALVLLHFSLLLLTIVQNGLVFLIIWETMALSAFIAVIFEHEKISTLKAGFNFLIQSHVSIIFLMLGFMYIAYKTGSYDFEQMGIYALGGTSGEKLILFLTFFSGFAVKAGFIPFHTWLPYAHPAAPAHISGLMSGVMIKIGIFGILRMLMIIRPDFITVGYIILFISLLSGLYGVMLAIVQHNLKRLLAYHSIENIGIIGIGIGVGSIGLGIGNVLVASLGFAGALLHTLNHALFKSLLFFAAGNVYQSTHTLNMEHLGGLIKKMPHTAILFLVGSVSIVGLPPFNGFISEFIIYSGLYQWLLNAGMLPLVAAIFTIIALVLIGGLAMLCFAKAVGVVFLGNPRAISIDEVHEVPTLQLVPLYLIVLLMAMIGFFPGIFMQLLKAPLVLFVGIEPASNLIHTEAASSLQSISRASWVLVIFVFGLFVLRMLVTKKRKITHESTWGCGYVAPDASMQYTAGSFVRSYTKLVKPLLLIHKKERRIQNIFPLGGQYETHPYDKLEKWLIDSPLLLFRSFLGKFTFLQNGKLQFYILYGIIFIILIISIPIIYELISEIGGYFKQL